jgi:alpha-tubulin suppressor-like RCC1 family protein
MIPLDFLDALQNGPGIRDIVVGDEHTIVLTLSGELYGFGSNHYGQLGVVADQNSSSIYTLQRLYAPAGMRGVICGVSAGARHTIFATNEGYLYGFGENALNPLGPRVDLRGTFIPQQLFIQPIVDGEVVKTTRNCTIVQMTNGDLWAWGNNNLGQLGLGHQNSVSEPTRICSVHNVMRVMMGERHTVVVTREGQLYGCGDVEAFQGFLENTSLSDHLLRFQPLPLQNHEMPLALAVGGSHTVVVSTNGVVYNSCRDIRFQIPEGEIFVAVTATIEGTILATRVG